MTGRQGLYRGVGSIRAAIIVAFGTAGFGAGCTNEQVNAVLTGVQVATTQLTTAQNDQITFLDWLNSALKD